MLYAVPKSIFSWDFHVYHGNTLLAVIDMAWLVEGGDFQYEEKAYYLKKEGMLSGNFSLESDGRVIAQAKKTPLVRCFEVENGVHHYSLAAASPFTRNFLLRQQEGIVGEIAPNHPLTRKCTINLPEDISVPTRLFMFWLVLLMWRRVAVATS